MEIIPRFGNLFWYVSTVPIVIGVTGQKIFFMAVIESENGSEKA